jgi:hypothetical protein
VCLPSLPTLLPNPIMPTKTDKKRTLNLEEKRLLEKLLLSDITRATSTYGAKRQGERQQLQERLISNAPAQVRALVDERSNAEKAVQRATEALRELGYSIGGYPAGLCIHSYGKQPHDLESFDAETKRIEARLTELKRAYTLRLFAGGEEAKALFSTLESAIADIVVV